MLKKLLKSRKLLVVFAVTLVYVLTLHYKNQVKYSQKQVNSLPGRLRNYTNLIKQGTTISTSDIINKSTQCSDISQVLYEDLLNCTSCHYDAHRVQDIRQTRLRRKCQCLNPTDSLSHYNKSCVLLPDALVLDKFRFMIQANAKTGRTAWQTVMWNNSLEAESTIWKNKKILDKVWQFDFLEKFGIKTLRSYSIEEANARLHSHYIVLTVRHPLTRLESAYIDKIKSKSYYHKLYGKDILRMYREKTAENARAFRTGKGVTFEEFLKFVIDHPTLDGHWQPHFNSSHPCLVNYSYIAKTETTNEDMDYIISSQLAGRGSHVIKNHHKDHKLVKVAPESGVILKLFSELENPKFYLDRLMNYYADDMDLFGYTYKIIDNNVIALCNLYLFNGLCV